MYLSYLPVVFAVDIELELERVLLEKADVQDDLMKMDAICINHEKDKARLQEDLKKVRFSTPTLCYCRIIIVPIKTFMLATFRWRTRGTNWQTKAPISREI